jgi:hypothetical protein
MSAPTLNNLRNLKARAEGAWMEEDDLAEIAADLDAASLIGMLCRLGYDTAVGLYAQAHELPIWAVESILSVEPLGDQT